ncbi:MAG TPA: FAD-binding protein [Solirubrobacterales bacterium]|nr:FAD-binding protein [Solirubrobacterales bacterium]
MIQRDDRGAQSWNGVHVTHRTTVAEIIDVDNVGPNGNLLAGFDMFRYVGKWLDGLIRDARDNRKRILPIGAGWALSRINITDGWLVNTKLLNGCYDIGDGYFDEAYPAAERRNVVLAQAGMQIAELNAYLELVPQEDADRRAIKAAGIGNGQTIAGSVSGNTHGAQITFGAMPDFVAGLHIATGSGRTLWIERASKPVLNEGFAAGIGAELIRNDDIFNAAVVSFGTFGIICAMAVETAPIYQLDFPPIVDIHHDDLKAKLRGFADAPPENLYHYEFIFDPHSRTEMAMEASAPKVPYEPGVRTPTPRWIIRDKNGYAPGINILRLLGLLRFVVPPRIMTGIEFGRYRKLALLDGVRGSPGQIYTSSIYYLEGYIESAYAVSVRDAPATIDISSDVAREMGLPSINQVRLCGASHATLAFTQHEPISAVFEFGMINDDRFPEFEARLDAAFRKAEIPYTMHWSKNSGIDQDKLEYMYGAAKIASWKAARRAVFGDDETLMEIFQTDAMVEAGLA